jgi:beta-N-acetylhexosaminidase
MGPPTNARAADPGLDAMIGQMLLIGFNGTSPTGAGARRVAAHIAKGEIGGVILMDHNIRSPQQVRALTGMFHKTGHPLAPFISVDQEGGLVQRLSSKKGFTAYPTARTVARVYSPERAKRIYAAMARELADAGFNLNYGPVVDLNVYRANPIIGRLGRSYGAKPEKVLAYARAFISAHREANVLTSIKHFPGHGSSRTDSHKRFVDLSKTWKDIEMEPYRVLAREGAIDTIMIGHLYHPAFSSEKRVPATLSRSAIDVWIRRKLGFQGVVITDDLEMAAVKKHHNLRETVIMAVNGGNDILMFSNAGRNPIFVARVTNIIRTAVENGAIPRERISIAYARIVALKERLTTRRSWLPAAITGSIR